MAGYYFEILEIVNAPEAIHESNAGESLATREIEPGKHLIVVYKELNTEDGFIITAFLTRKIKQLERRVKLWPR